MNKMNAYGERSFPVRQQRGVAAVEFAIVLPILLLLLLGTAELGRAFYQYDTLVKSIRGAARYLSTVAINGTTGLIELSDDKIQETEALIIYGNSSAVGQPLLPGLDDPGRTTITVTQPDAVHVQVSVTYTYSGIFVAIPTFGYQAGDLTVDGIPFQASIAMRAI